MYLTDKDYPTDQLKAMVVEPPVSKGAIEAFTNIYKITRGFLDNAVFTKVRDRIESALGSPLNLRKRLDKATFGRFIVWGELSHRQALPYGWQSFNLLMDDEPTIEQLVIPFDGQSHSKDAPTETKDTSKEVDFSNQKNLSKEVKEIKEERDRATAQARRYHQQLREFEEFTKLLLVGRIFAEPPKLNGLEEAPLLQVFGGARSLSEVHQAYRELRKAWHPDISPFGESETNARFDWLKKAYTTLVNNWSRFDPQNEQIPADRIEKLKAQQLRWEADSFWYWDTKTQRH